MLWNQYRGLLVSCAAPYALYPVCMTKGDKLLLADNVWGAESLTS